MKRGKKRDKVVRPSYDPDLAFRRRLCRIERRIEHWDDIGKSKLKPCVKRILKREEKLKALKREALKREEKLSKRRRQQQSRTDKARAFTAFSESMIKIGGPRYVPLPLSVLRLVQAFL